MTNSDSNPNSSQVDHYKYGTQVNVQMFCKMFDVNIFQICNPFVETFAKHLWQTFGKFLKYVYVISKMFG